MNNLTRIILAAIFGGLIVKVVSVITGQPIEVTKISVNRCFCDNKESQEDKKES